MFRVLTGLHFVKVNRVFHLQIQEGELLPRGKINASSLHWVPVDNYTLNERGVRNNRDYYTLSYGARSIDLDDVHTEDNSFVVTGVRFRVVGAHLNLEARLSEFNFETGKLVNPEENSFWKSNDNTDVSGDKRYEMLHDLLPKTLLIKLFSLILFGLGKKLNLEILMYRLELQRNLYQIHCTINILNLQLLMFTRMHHNQPYPSSILST